MDSKVLFSRRILGFFVLLACIGNAQDSTSTDPAGKRQAKIAFNASPNVQKRADIFEVNVDGSGLLQLTPDSKLYSRWNCCPAWSPDGTELAFVSMDRRRGVGKTHSALYVLKPGTEGPRRLLRDDTVCLRDPAWSPDGRRLVFARDIESRAFRFDVTCNWPCGRSQLFSINVDGSGLQQLTQQAGSFNQCPAWSPDGSAIAYAARSLSNPDRKADIYIMGPDGSNPRALTLGGADEDNTNPAWSPDSAEIAFTSNRDGNFEIYAMRCDGSGTRQLTHGSKGRYAQHPTWSSDGHQIAFSSWEGQHLPSIYVMNADGTDLHLLVKIGWHPAYRTGPGQ